MDENPSWNGAWWPGAPTALPPAVRKTVARASMTKRQKTFSIDAVATCYHGFNLQQCGSHRRITLAMVQIAAMYRRIKFASARGCMCDGS